MQNIKRIFTFLSNKLKIRHKLFLSLITLILLLSFSTYLFAQHFTNRISDQLIYQYLQTEHRLILDNISMYLDEVVMLSLRYKNNSDFYTILDDTDTTSEEKQKKLLDAASAIWLSDTKAVTNVYLFTPDETVYALKEEKSLPLPTKNCINPELSSPYYYISEPFADADGIWYLPISMKFYNYNTFQEIGYLIFYLPQNAVTNLFYEIFCDSEITFLTDQNGTILFHKYFEHIGETIGAFDMTLADTDFYVKNVTFNNESCVAVSSSLDSSAWRIGFSWQLFTVIPYRILHQSTRHLQLLLIFFVILIVIFASFLSLHFSAKLTDSIKALSQKLRCIKEGNMHSFFNTDPQNELWELEQGYNEMLQIKVPKIILQPIVENAIKHGVSQTKRHGIITIRGYYIDDDIYLEVTDNGNGFQNKSSSLRGSGYGLKNIKERIQLEYGETYGLSINSKPGEGTTVQLHIHFGNFK